MWRSIRGFAWSVGIWGLCSVAQGQISESRPPPLIGADVIFEEVDGLVAVEAEHFSKQSMNSVRAWYLNSPAHCPGVQPDHDDASFADAGGLCYMEAIPDLFHTDRDPIINGHNLGGNLPYFGVRTCGPSCQRTSSTIRLC